MRQSCVAAGHVGQAELQQSVKIAVALPGQFEEFGHTLQAVGWPPALRVLRVLGQTTFLGTKDTGLILHVVIVKKGAWVQEAWFRNRCHLDQQVVWQYFSFNEYSSLNWTLSEI